MSLVGKIGVFTSEDDTAWGDKYANKQCTVIRHIEYTPVDELLVEFEDGQRLVFGVDEFKETIN